MKNDIHFIPKLIFFTTVWILVNYALLFLIPYTPSAWISFLVGYFGVIFIIGIFSKIFYEIFLQNIIEKQVKTNPKQYKKHLTSRLLFSLFAALFPFYRIVYLGDIYHFNQYQIFILSITIVFTYIVVLSFYSRVVDIIFEALFPNMPRSIFEVTDKDATTYITKEKTISKGALKRGCFFYLSLILLFGAGYLIILFK